MTRPGLASCSTGQPSPHSSMVPGRKFSTSTSDLAHRRMNSSTPRLLAQVDRHRLLVARFRQPGEGGVVPLRRRAEPAHRVARDRMLDLQHLSAVFAHDRCGVGPGEKVANVDDAHAGQRQGARCWQGMGIRAARGLACPSAGSARCRFALAGGRRAFFLSTHAKLLLVRLPLPPGPSAPKPHRWAGSSFHAPMPPLPGRSGR